MIHHRKTMAEYAILMEKEGKVHVLEIVDESDQVGIDDGLLHEDMRELAKIRYDSESE